MSDGGEQYFLLEEVTGVIRLRQPVEDASNEFTVSGKVYSVVSSNVVSEECCNDLKIKALLCYMFGYFWLVYVYSF